MNINIKITEGCGIVVNRNELSLREANLKDSLYGGFAQPAQRDRPVQTKPPVPPKVPTSSAKKPPKRQSEERKMSEQDVRQFQREMNSNIKEFSKNQASLGMLHTNNQIIRAQHEILAEQQSAIEQLKRKKSEDSETRKPVQETREPQQMLRDMTSGLNRELDEIRRLRDDIMRTAREFSETVSKAKAGEAPPALPANLVEMNKNLKTMVQTSQQNIDLISPEKLELLGKLQNFNLEGYTQHLNNLKAQIALVHRESEQVEKELKQRLAKLEKLTITPKFEEQLAQPYEQNIKRQLQTIDLQQARRTVLDKLGGDFDYTGFEAGLSQVAAELKQEMGDFYLTLQKYRIDVPEIRLDARELKALDIKLPSILEQYKAAHGIVAPPAPQRQTNVPSAGKQIGQLGRTGGSQARGTGELARTGSVSRPTRPNEQRKISQIRQRSIEQLATRPKDLATNIKYKNLSEDEPFNTVLNQKTTQQQRKEAERRIQKQPQPEARQQPKRKTRQEEDFDKYLESRAQEELEQLYKERKESLERMKHQLYEEATSEPMVQLVVDRRNRMELERPSEQRKQSQEKNRPAKKPAEHAEQLGEPGRKLIDTTEGMVIKEIGKEVLLEKIKSIFQVEKSEKKEPEFKPSSPQPAQLGVAPNAAAGFAEGFLSVINSTLSAMNRGLSTGIQQKLRQRDQRSPDPLAHERRVPLPALEEIPKPPVFNLKFDRNIRHAPAQQQPLRSQTGGFPTFSNNFHAQSQQPQQVGLKNYSHLDVSDVSSYSQIDLDKEQVKSHMSGLSNTSNLDISRSGNLTKSRQ